MILYTGNKLSKHGYTPTSVETLGVQLSHDFEIVTVSDKINKIMRIIDIAIAIIRYRKKISKVIIDTYSTSNFYFTLIAAILCRRFHIPYIPILHGGALPQRLDRSKRFSKLIFAHSFINVAPSGYLKHEFKQRGYSNVIHIPNNIDISGYPFKMRNQTAPKLLWVRSFSAIYNPTMAIRVLADLQIKYPQAKLCMVGQDKDGSMLQCRQLAKESGVEDVIIFTGKLSKKEWITLSEEYDIFINTTNVDNTPVSVVEAMALGLPVISTGVGGIPFLITDKHDGLLVEANNKSQMLNQIIKLIEDPGKSQQLSQNARKKAENFDWNAVKDSWYKILE